MTFEEFCIKFVEWTIRDVEAKKLDGFAVCPFARKARITNAIQFMDCRDNNLDSYRAFDRTKFEIGIAWVDGNNIVDVQTVLDVLSSEHPELLYFTSTPESGHFVQNFTNCVFIQSREDIMEKRAVMQKTSYYDSWPKAYLDSITSV